MKRFIQGESRTQSTLLPELLDDYIDEANPVRVIDVYVDELDLGKLGFSGVAPAATGRPAYHPAVLLKLYIYGYLNRIQSSRRLEPDAMSALTVTRLRSRGARSGRSHRSRNSTSVVYSPSPGAVEPKDWLTSWARLASVASSSASSLGSTTGN